MTTAIKAMFYWTALLSALSPFATAVAQPAPTPKVSTEQAKAAALKAVSGRVTSVVIEKKQGKNVYVIEIMTRSGGEKDVFVDIDTGQVVGTED